MTEREYQYPGYPIEEVKRGFILHTAWEDYIAPQAEYIAAHAPPGIPYEPGQDWEPEEVNSIVSGYARHLEQRRLAMEGYVTIQVSECRIPRCKGCEWVFLYEDIGLVPLHYCDGVIPGPVSNTLMALTGYTLEEFKLLAFTYDEFPRAEREPMNEAIDNS